MDLVEGNLAPPAGPRLRDMACEMAMVSNSEWQRVTAAERLPQGFNEVGIGQIWLLCSNTNQL